MRNLEKASVSFRIGSPQWLSDERFDGLMRLFERHKGVTDEITFFTAETHAPLPLDETKRRCDLLKKRMEVVRRCGYRTGINILSTMGHLEENFDHSLQADYLRVTDIDGNTCRTCFCPSDLRFREEYVRPVYEMLVAANPDYIWIDDDVRLLFHPPVIYACFCDNCLANFSTRQGRPFTREVLKQAFGQDKRDAKLGIRKAWLQHLRDTMTGFFSFLENVVHGIAPQMPLGMMDGGAFYAGFDYANWTDALAGLDDVEVMWRPGAATYTEEVPDAVVQKAHQLGREASFIPEKVRCIQAELESFPYQRLRKSEHFTKLEAACYIAAGCTGTAFNVLSMYDEPLDDYDSLVGRLAKARPFLDLLASTLAKESPAGLHNGANMDLFVGRNVSRGEWFGGCKEVPGPVVFPEEMYKCGIPAAYRADRAAVMALSGESVWALNDDEIRLALSRGVYMDADALNILNARGYQELTGFTVARSFSRDCIERLVEHDLNGVYAGRCRDGRQSFWNRPAYEFTPTETNAEILAQLVDYADQQVANCSMGVFENKLGGRVCVAGYYPWEQLQYQFKTTQVKNVMRWLSGNRLGAYVESYHRIALWDRITQNGSHAVALTNLYLDPAENVSLMLLTENDEIDVYDMDCNRTSVNATDVSGDYKRFILPRIDPWHICLAVQKT